MADQKTTEIEITNKWEYEWCIEADQWDESDNKMVEALYKAGEFQFIYIQLYWMEENSHYMMEGYVRYKEPVEQSNVLWQLHSTIEASDLPMEINALYWIKNCITGLDEESMQWGNEKLLNKRVEKPQDPQSNND